MQGIRQFFNELNRVYLVIFKIMVPALLLVEVLDWVGATDWLSLVLAPLFEQMGLPSEFAIVWAVAMLSNMYAGLVIFFGYAATETYTVAQVSILGTMILIAHSMLMEGAVAKALGVSWRVTLLVRVGGAIVMALILNQIYQWTGFHQQTIELNWNPVVNDPSLSGWLIEQAKLLVSVYVIIGLLMLLMRVLRAVGIEKLIHQLFAPILRLMALSSAGTNITVIGMLLGITYGAGLMIEENKRGAISKQEGFLLVNFLGLCHGLPEDTLLILLMGASIVPILWGRIAFSLIVMIIWGQWAKRRQTTAVSIS